jgi:hypothetical protein
MKEEGEARANFIPHKFMKMRTLLHIAKTPRQKNLKSYKVLIGMLMRPGQSWRRGMEEARATERVRQDANG